jgi:drug/metabolite transporter (DMT)-like permease
MGIEHICNYSNSSFISPLLIFISQIFAGFIPLYLNNKNKKISQKYSKYLGIKFIQKRSTIIQPDKQIKIYTLIIFGSFFNYVGVITRGNIDDSHFENKIRGIQIIFSALLCYFTIRIKIYKHQIFSLIFIIIIILIILVIDIFLNKEKSELPKLYGLGIFSCFSRAFLDTIEKYLFEFDYLNPYKVLMIEGLIGCLFLPILFFMDKTYEDFKEFSEKKVYQLIILIICLLIYSGLSLFKNIFRVLTIKFYSPMTRALAESIIDPFDFIYLVLKEIIVKNEVNYHYIAISIALCVISFLSFVYNDFIVLYCFGLEYNTHLEIQNRAILYENIDGSIMDLERETFNEKENNNEKAELSVQ